MEIRLSDADRERLGCPEWVELDLGRLSMEEGRALEAVGVEYTSFGGATVEGTKCSVWIALRRIGVVVPYAEFEFDLRAHSRDSGKASGTSTPSVESTASESGS